MRNKKIFHEEDFFAYCPQKKEVKESGQNHLPVRERTITKSSARIDVTAPVGLRFMKSISQYKTVCSLVMHWKTPGIAVSQIII